MTKSVTSFLKGVGTGAAIGAVTTVTLSCCKMGNTRTAKKKLSHIAKTASEFMDNVSSMLK